jgi:hypothetical protein
VRSLYRSALLVRELARYKLDLVSVQEVRWDKGGTARAGGYTFFDAVLVLININDSGLIS